MNKLDKYVGKILLSEDEIKSINARLAKEISQYYQSIGEDFEIIGILNGCLPFLIDLTRLLPFSVRYTLLNISSYKGGFKSNNRPTLEQVIPKRIKDKNILIIEDIVDTGRTLNLLTSLLKERNCNIKICSLLDKPSQRVAECSVDFVGKTIDNVFVLGYGLDIDEEFRNIPYVATYKEDK